MEESQKYHGKIQLLLIFTKCFDLNFQIMSPT